MIKYFCDICEVEVDRDNPLSELTIIMRPLDSIDDSGTILLMTQVCTNCIESIKVNPTKMFQITVRGY